MRTLIIAAATLSFAAAAQAQPQHAPRAPSAERFAVQASYTAPAPERIGVGYSLQQRKIADCLADQASRGAQRTPAAVERRCDI